MGAHGSSQTKMNEKSSVQQGAMYYASADICQEYPAGQPWEQDKSEILPHTDEIKKKASQIIQSLSSFSKENNMQWIKAKHKTSQEAGTFYISAIRGDDKEKEDDVVYLISRSLAPIFWQQSSKKIKSSSSLSNPNYDAIVICKLVS